MAYGKGNDPRGFSTFSEAFLGRVVRDPDGIALGIITEGAEVSSTLSAAQIWRHANSIAAMLQERLAVRDRALLVFEAGEDFFETFLGCVLAGVIPAPLAMPESPTRIDLIRRTAADCNAALILTSQKLIQAAGGASDIDGIPLTAPRQWRSETEPNFTPFRARPEDIAFLQYTSGSTGDPKGVRVTHKNIMANLQMIAKAMGIGQDAVVVSWLPHYHDMGLIGNMITPLLIGKCVWQLAPEHFLRRPALWLQTITNQRGTHTGGPNFAFDLCVDRIAQDEAQTLDLASLEVIYSGAEPIREKTASRFIERFSRHHLNTKAFFPCYGLAETTLIVSGGPHLSGHDVKYLDAKGLALGRANFSTADTGVSVVNCGQILGNQTVKIVDPHKGQPLPDGGVGEIWISGPAVTSGYWGKDALNVSDFGARLPGDENSYLKTGDLGFIDRGNLHITGRCKDLIIVHGHNFYPQDIEHTAETAWTGVRKGRSVAVGMQSERGELVHLLVETKLEMSPTQIKEFGELISSRVFESHHLALSKIVFLAPEQMVKTTSGKVRRSESYAQFEAGKFKTLGLWNSKIQENIEATRQPIPITQAGEGAKRRGVESSPPSSRNGSPPSPLSLAAKPTKSLFTQFSITADKAKIQDSLKTWLTQREPQMAGVADAEPLLGRGLDSVISLELQQFVEDTFKVRIPTDVMFASPTIEKIATYVVENPSATARRAS